MAKLGETPFLLSPPPRRSYFVVIAPQFFARTRKRGNGVFLQLGAAAKSGRPLAQPARHA